MRILIIGGVARSVVNFRGPLIRAMLAKGHDVWACAGYDDTEVGEQLRAWGAGFIPIHLSRAGMRPWEDLRTCWELYRLMGNIRPDAVLAYTIKPVIWGGVAAWWARVPAAYSLITGLGYAFNRSNDFRARLAGSFASLLYKLSLNKNRRVFFQNPDDMQEFIALKLVQRGQCLLVNGSGVDLAHYESAFLSPMPHFLMICRLLADKGVREYVQAARKLRLQFPMGRFLLAGALDPNPTSVSQTELDAWQREGVIGYLGNLDDVRPAYRDCNVYVLPSYREGTPRTVLEAMAMGRPIITTDAPGCRETVPLTARGREQKARGESVMEGENGFLIKVRDVESLTQAMEIFIRQPELMRAMGRRSRKIAEEKFDVHKVNRVMLEVMGL